MLIWYDMTKFRFKFRSQVPKLSSAAEYFFKMGVQGKRFRPTVNTMMLMCSLFGFASRLCSVSVLWVNIIYVECDFGGYITGRKLSIYFVAFLKHLSVLFILIFGSNNIIAAMTKDIITCLFWTRKMPQSPNLRLCDLAHIKLWDSVVHLKLFSHRETCLLASQF